MFFTKKYNYFSQESRWTYPFLSQPPIKGCFGTLRLGDEVWWPVLYNLNSLHIVQWLIKSYKYRDQLGGFLKNFR